MSILNNMRHQLLLTYQTNLSGNFMRSFMGIKYYTTPAKLCNEISLSVIVRRDKREFHKVREEIHPYEIQWIGKYRMEQLEP